MKNKVGVWIDMSKAIIITLKGAEKEVQVIEGIDNRERIPGEGKSYTRFGSQFSNQEKQKEGRMNQQVKDYLKKVMKALTHSESIIIFGPSKMKQELAKLIMKNKDQKLRGVVAADSMTENQMVAWVVNHYKTDNH
ncbi:MAG TPA: hypothetical protein VIS49_03800 [Cyclobacteriaceae bacterium]